jgi:hypothetical protein
LTDAPEAGDQAAIERWFIRRGLPHFIDGYSAGTDIWTRSLPVLGIAYVAGGLNALDLDEWSVARNLAAAALVAVVLIAGLVVANLARRQRLLAMPRKIGPGELSLFVIGPSLPALLLGQPGDALQSIVTGLAVLLVIYIVTSYGLVPMTKWSVSQLWEQFADLGHLVVKALPLLLLFVTFLFVNAEVWQVAGNLDGLVYWLVLLLFFTIGAAFVLARVPAEVSEINRFASLEVASRLARDAGAPVALEQTGTVDGDANPPLSRRSWANIALVMLVTQAIQVLLVGAAVGGFLIGFGLLAINREIVESWTGDPANSLWAPTLGGRELLLSEELLRVSGFLAAFTALYFTVYLVTDPTYREQFRDEVVKDVRGALAARACYLYERRAGRDTT